MKNWKITIYSKKRFCVTKYELLWSLQSFKKQLIYGRKNSSESSCYAYIYCYFYVFTQLYKSLK